MTYDVYLQVEDDDLIYAHVPVLPGCCWHGATKEEAVASGPQAIAEHLAWLRRHGRSAPAADEEIIVHPHGLEGTAAGAGLAEGLFEHDRRPMTMDEVRELVAIMACSRADLMDLVRSLPDETLDRAPAPGSWPIRAILGHVAGGETFLLRLLLEPSEVPPFEPSWTIWRQLDWARRVAVERLMGLDEAQRAAIVFTDGEPFTARKVLRRLIEHEREHYGHVREVLDALAATRDA